MTPALPVSGPNITNIVCGVNLNCMIDLNTVSLHARNTFYNPKRFPAVVLRIREPKATALVFAKGKMQILGSRSVDDAKLAARRFARMIKKLGFNVRLDGFNVQNIVANADCKMPVRLEGLALTHRHFARFEPEIFPGLVYRIEVPKITVLVFAMGKLVFLGARREQDIDEALRLLYPVLKQFLPAVKD